MYSYKAPTYGQTSFVKKNWKKQVKLPITRFMGSNYVRSSALKLDKYNIIRVMNLRGS